MPPALARPSEHREGPPRSRRVGWLPRLADPVALAVLAAIVLVSFRGALSAGLVAFEADTLRFYYPLERWFAEEFKAGRFPLWNPYIFAGYPIFGDGELGFAYPLHLLLLTFLSGDQTYIWLRISTHLIAAGSMYALGRALRLGPIPSLIGGLTFSLGSFLPAQEHHENMTRSVAWTPLALACAEWGFRSRGWGRWAWNTMAAVAVAMGGLGLHPQGLAMSLIVVSTFIAARALFGGLETRTAAGRAAQAVANLRAVVGRVPHAAASGLYIVGLGLAMAAVQLLPVAERGTATFRASQPDYRFATSYALPPVNLIDLIFPYFYRGPDSTYWSLWSPWETTIYVGVLPLLLGVVGAVAAWRSAAVYFLLLALGGLWLAFASYAPLDLYSGLWSLPGFSAFRVPGRYSLLFVLGWAVLAAYGAHQIAKAAPWTARRKRAAAATAAVAIALTGGLAVGIEVLREQILLHEKDAFEIIRNVYLGMRHHQEGLPAEQVFTGLIHSLDVTTPRTAAALLFLGCAGITLAAAILRGRKGLAFQAVCGGLVAVDLLTFTSGLHYERPVTELAATAPSAQYLSERAADGRVFVPLPTPAVQANRLVPLGVEDIGGYSSLESRRNFTFWSRLTGTHNQLLDLANVRYLVYPVRRTTQPSFEQVPFDPEKPLFVGPLNSAGGREVWDFQTTPTTQVRVIGALTHGFEVPQDAVVAEVTLILTSGAPVVIPLRAGVDLAEWAYERPDAIGRIQHGKPDRVAFRRPNFDPVFNASYPLYLWYSYHDLGRRVDVDRVEVRYVYPRGSMELHGLGLFDDQTGRLQAAHQERRSKFRLAYRDAEIEVYENRDVLPQVRFVTSAVVGDPGYEGVGSLLYSPFDPRQSIVLDPGDHAAWATSQAPSASDAATIQVLEKWNEGARYEISSPSSGFLYRAVSHTPQWHAWVEGESRPVLRANYLFQAVPVPAGTHTVELRYESTLIRVGLQITVAAVGLALVVLLGAAARALARLRIRRAKE